ncbi:hypothetical protein ABE073_04650 [Lederbergia citrisecunda]|uniref:hypothetical protein n=1 Tax=Lederbergia citrisecunda TaxID=2833583 RepID=UPI003D26E411
MIEDEYKVTIEEWAGDVLGLVLKDEQVQELVDSLSICSEMFHTSGAFSGGQSEEEKEIKRLKKKISGLESFIASKNIPIYLDDNYVEEFYDVRISHTHVTTNSKKHYYN